jgi:hypothetical protein
LEIIKYPPNYFDVVVIDGQARVLSAWLAAKFVKPNGIIVFDNSDREFYSPGFELLANDGYKRIDFYGTGPINMYEWCTSIFFKGTEWLTA